MSGVFQVAFGAGVGVAIVAGFWALADVAAQMSRYATQRERD